MIATLEAEAQRDCEDEASTHVNAQKIQNLYKLKAIGPEFARCWLARYSIVTSTIAANWRVMSASRRARSRAETWRMTKDQQGLVTARTNHRDRTRLAVAALSTDSDLSVWFRTRVGTTKGRIRRIAIVALARKLLVALWRYLETGVGPRGAVLKGDERKPKYR